jgi:hypothetical protein
MDMDERIWRLQLLPDQILPFWGKNEATPNQRGEAAEKVSGRSSDLEVHHQSRTIRGVPVDGWVKAKASEASRSDPSTVEMVANRSDPGTIEMVANGSDVYRFFPVRSDHLGEKMK